MTNKTRRKLSEVNKGKYISKATCKKISEANKGRCVSNVTRKKISEALKGKNNPMFGKHPSAKTRQKMSASRKGKKNHNWGKHLSEKTRQKLSKALQGKIKGKNHPSWGKHHSKATCKKISEAGKGRKSPRLGKHLTKATRLKISKARQGKYCGKNAPWFGKHLSKATRQKLSEAQLGEKSHNWLGGISLEPYGVKFTKQLREQIRERDNFTCQECKKTQEELGYRFNVHHIDYNKKNHNPNNLISLCNSCHCKTNYSREAWTKHFREMLTEKLQGVRKKNYTYEGVVQEQEAVRKSKMCLVTTFPFSANSDPAQPFLRT